jgi:hypothetical protein
MKHAAAAFLLILAGCGSTVPWERAPQVNEAACSASCDAHFDQCPQVFAGFPERGAVECPAEHNNCLRNCANGHAPARPAATPPVIAPPAPPATPVAAVSSPTAASSARAMASKEARLRELKHFYDEGLVTEDVYRDRQKAILAEP